MKDVQIKLEYKGQKCSICFNIVRQKLLYYIFKIYYVSGYELF